MEDLKVTSLEELKQVAEGEIIELPKFREDMPFNARVRKISLLGLVTKGVIPNSLLGEVNKLFHNDIGAIADEKANFEDMSKVMKIIAENTLVHPTIKDLQEIGLELTDEQLVSLFIYSQRGIEGLSTFRDQLKNGNDLSD